MLKSKLVIKATMDCILNLRGFDGDAPLLLIFPRVSESGFASFRTGNNTGFANKRVC